MIETAVVQLNQHQTAQDLLNAKKKPGCSLRVGPAYFSAGNFVASGKFGNCFYKISKSFIIQISQSHYSIFGLAF